MERLARPLSDLSDHYHVVVVGSGYGGSIAACRLSRAGRKVALLERGREMHPGEYPATVREAGHHVQTTGPAFGSERQIGDPRNLYRFHADGEMNVFSGCGLGGTSLINANVSLRPEARVFDERWPSELRQDGHGTMAGELDAGFAAAEAMLRPMPYPDTFPPLAKVAALRMAAGASGITPTPINVTFREGPNVAGVHQQACTGCGDCVTGCNVGAKNTLLMNYLPDAVAHGAQVFTELDVRTVTQAPDGRSWIVGAQPLGLGRQKEFDAPPLAVTADVVVLAAGTMGTTEILLRSHQAGLSVSDQLGLHFTGNGDVIGFAERRDVSVRAIGAGDQAPDPARPAGPCITAVIDRRSEGSLTESMIIEDAVVPGLMAEVVAADLALQLGAVERKGDRRLRAELDGLASLFTGGHKGGSEHLQTFLVMGHDDGQGRMLLEDDQLRIEWPGVGTSAYYQRANQALAAAAGQGGGTFVRNPLWSHHLHDGLITVHPLGGCVIGKSAKRGVVDHRGRVFDPDRKGAVHHGLIVADGSIVPAPLGVNPLLTISALTERTMALLCAEHGWTYDTTPMATVPPEAPAGTPPAPDRPGLRFTEKMAGWWSPDPSADRGSLSPYLAAEEKGMSTPDGALSFVLTIATDDVAKVTSQLDTPMAAVGTVSAPALSPDPLLVHEGRFQLFVADEASDASVRHMRYRLPLTATDGRRFVLDAFKVIARGEVGEVWPATTTLYATLRHHGRYGKVIGRGVLHIAPADFARQLRTMHVTGPVGHLDRLSLEARFGRAFAGPLAHDYGTVVHRTTSFDPAAPPRRRRSLDVPPPRHHEYRTADGLTLRLTRYRGGNSAPVVLAHGMGNPYTWSLDTVDRTLLEVLVHHGYDVWVQEWRSSTLLESSRTQFTADQVAHLDHPAAAAVVAAETGRSDLHLITHCVGSLTWMMATLAGTVDPSSLLCSSVGIHPVAPTLTRLKVGLRLGEILHRVGVRRLTTDSTTNESFWERQFDRELRLYPIPREEECDQAVCRRVAFIYGNAVHHPNLNAATHAALHELFGVTNMTMMDHLSVMARRGQVVSATGQDRYLVHLERLRRPVTFVHGARNLVWLPASTEQTYDLLVGQFGPGDYDRVVFDDYGHQDLLNGARAAADTYPAFLDHLKRVNA
jgi:cholesterol oxidase